MTPGDSLGASSVMSQLMASNHFSEIGANRVQIRGFERRGCRAFHVSGFDEQQRSTHRRHIALGRHDRSYETAARSRDDVLHLHRFEHDELLSLMHRLPGGHIDRDHDAGHRRPHGDRTLRTGWRRRRRRARIIDFIENRFRRSGRRRLDERSHMGVEKPGDMVRRHVGMVQHRPQEADIGVQSLDTEFTERASGPQDGVPVIGCR